MFERLFGHFGAQKKGPAEKKEPPRAETADSFFEKLGFKLYDRVAATYNQGGTEICVVGGTRAQQDPSTKKWHFVIDLYPTVSDAKKGVNSSGFFTGEQVVAGQLKKLVGGTSQELKIISSETTPLLDTDA